MECISCPYQLFVMLYFNKLQIKIRHTFSQNKILWQLHYRRSTPYIHNHWQNATITIYWDSSIDQNLGNQIAHWWSFKQINLLSQHDDHHNKQRSRQVQWFVSRDRSEWIAHHIPDFTLNIHTYIPTLVVESILYYFFTLDTFPFDV